MNIKQIYYVRQILLKDSTVCGNALLQVQAELIDGLVGCIFAADDRWGHRSVPLAPQECVSADGGNF